VTVAKFMSAMFVEFGHGEMALLGFLGQYPDCCKPLACGLSKKKMDARFHCDTPTPAPAPYWEERRPQLYYVPEVIPPRLSLVNWPIDIKK